MAPTGLVVTLDARASTPPYEQIRAQIAGLAAAGTLAAGTRLPTVRALAARLAVAPNTVARSYRELEAAGVIETHGRSGSVVSAAGSAARQRLVDAAGEYATLAREVGIEAVEALAILASAIQASGAP